MGFPYIFHKPLQILLETDIEDFHH